MAFGEFVKELRLKLGLGLREFCAEHGHDPSNWSKIERGVTPPPSSREILTDITRQLKLSKNSEDYLKFFDLASLERGKIPEDIMQNKYLVQQLPVFFRTIRCQKPTEEDLRNLIELLKDNNRA